MASQSGSFTFTGGSLLGGTRGDRDGGGEDYEHFDDGFEVEGEEDDDALRYSATGEVVFSDSAGGRGR